MMTTMMWKSMELRLVKG
ncbi:hypothetical protein LINPERPRIM_LOCUS17989 [Linum perenne]